MNGLEPSSRAGADSGRQPQESVQFEVPWKPRNAWRCVFALVVLEVLISLWIRIAQRNPGASSWLIAHEYSAQSVLKVLRFGLWLLAAYFFSGAWSLARFTQSTGLGKWPTLQGWWGCCAAVGIALLDRYGGARGLTIPNPVSHGFYQKGGGTLAFYVLYVTSMGPFYEEVVLRGFLYRALRSSYGWLRSATIVVCAGAFFHWGAATPSLWAAICLILLWVLLCGIVEWTGSVWDCVFCHAAYNAVQVLKWPFYILVMLLLLALCIRRRRQA